MSSPRTMLTLSSRLLLTFAIGAFTLAPDARAQEGERRERVAQTQDSQEQENEEVRTVRKRLKVMRYAVDAFLEAERHDAAELVELAMHTRELAIEGVRNEKSAAVAKAAPNRGQLAELLGAASNLYEKWGKRERSHALAELAEVYGQQWRRQKRAEDEGRTTGREGGREQEGRRGEGLDSLERRVHIIGIARAAFDRAGRERNERAMANAVRYGKMALEGSNEEALAKAAESVPSRGNLIELLNAAHNLLTEEGELERATGCHQLAEYYTRQLRAERGEGGEGREEREGQRERDSDREREGEREQRGGIEDLGRRIEILHLAYAALAEAGKEDWAHRMGRFIRVAEMQAAGAEGEALEQAFEGLSMGMTIELLQKATGLYREWGQKERASSCNQLAEFYAARERGQSEGGERERAQANERERAQANERERRAGAERERAQANERERAQANERERRAGAERERARARGSLENREQRIVILRFAYNAWRESENQRAADLMERVLHLAELQLTGAGDERIAEASEGLTQGAIIELVQGAQRLYTKRGNQERAAACRRLVEFYKNRAESREGEGGEREQAREREQGATNKEAQIHELMQRIERMQLELREIQVLLRELVER